MSGQMYAWIGKDGGWKIGMIVSRTGHAWLMQHYHAPNLFEWVDSEAFFKYPCASIPEPTK